MTKASPSARCRCRSRRARCSVALVSLAVLACACSTGHGSTRESGAAPVVATTSIWADIVSRTTCGRVEVPAMIPPGTDAHSYEPSVQDADAMRSADLVVANGLGLEDGMHAALQAARSDGSTVLEVAPAVVPDDQAHDDHAHDDQAHDDQAHDGEAADEHGPRDGTDDGAHVHGEGDPHVWMDPELVAASVPVIADALRKVDSLGISPEELDRCAKEYGAQLDELTAEVRKTLSVVPLEQRKLVTSHETLGRFAERFDLEVVGTILPSTSSLAEANPRDLDELEKAMRDEGVEVVFTETTGDQRVARALVDRLGDGARVVPLYAESLGAPGAVGDAPTSYVEMMRRDAELIAESLRRAP